MAQGRQVRRRVFLQWLGLGGMAAACAEERKNSGDQNLGTTRDGGMARDSGIDPASDMSPASGYANPASDPVLGPGGYPCDPTTADVIGPFYEAGAPSTTRIAADDEPGERIVIRGTVRGPDCATPLEGVLLDVWQADQDGNYHEANQDYRLRGALMTDAEGSYRFETIMPGRYALSSGLRPAHIHLTISKPGYTPLTTQLYFEGDPYLAPEDACGAGCHSEEPDRIVALGEGAPRKGNFDVVLATSRNDRMPGGPSDLP